MRVTLEITPLAPHVFQGFSAALDEAAPALESVTASSAPTSPARPSSSPRVYTLDRKEPTIYPSSNRKRDIRLTGCPQS